MGHSSLPFSHGVNSTILGVCFNTMGNSWKGQLPPFWGSAPTPRATWVTGGAQSSKVKSRLPHAQCNHVNRQVLEPLGLSILTFKRELWVTTPTS